MKTLFNTLSTVRSPVCPSVLQCVREKVCSWHGILFKEPNSNREPPKRPNWAL